MHSGDSHASVIDPGGLQTLFDELGRAGFTVVGPTIEDGAVVYQPLTSSAQLPIGWRDEQSGGRYRLIASDRPALFDYVVGPHSWKRWLYPPRHRLWRALADGDGFRVEAEVPNPERYAFIGVRPCEIKAMQVQDRVLSDGPFSDTGYRLRRDDALVIAVNCGRPADTCFCTSMDTGPRVDATTGGYDLVITELFEGGRHRLLVEAGTDPGAELLSKLDGQPATDHDREASETISHDAAAAISRRMVPNVAELLEHNAQHPRWDQVAERCLSCANCTLVCPTCFCTTTEDSTDLDGRVAERWRQWDSCFTSDFSYIHGGSIRRSGSSRYRQWMTHKLSSWHHQFGSSGCVGCGRCITWCPVGIDITEEARAIRGTEE